IVFHKVFGLNYPCLLHFTPFSLVHLLTMSSSEAIMLAGLAFKSRWQNKRKAEGKPNIVTGGNIQTGLLGEVREVLQGGASGSEAAGRLLRDGPGEGCRDGGREHHLRSRDPGLHAQR
ncbi:unnamed protein product, partial [Urochloa humidicola]